MKRFFVALVTAAVIISQCGNAMAAPLPMKNGDGEFGVNFILPYNALISSSLMLPF
jgi:hypothetical protein